MVKISTLLLAKDEEANLPRCLEALRWCDDVVLVDDYSSDATATIATDFGARVAQRHFDSFASQRNWALAELGFEHGWVLHLDADEVCTPDLVAEMVSAISSDRFLAYRIPSKMMFEGHWLRHAATYPAYQVRLGRNPGLRFVQVGHGQREDLDQSVVGTLESAYLHYSFAKGLDDWFSKHNRYAAHEAQAAVEYCQRNELTVATILALGRSAERRRALRELSYRLPFRPLLRFFYMYILRLGLLDGRRGLVYCRLLAMYEYLITLKMRELRLRGRGGQL